VRSGEVGFATWQKHRMCALVADEEGEFTSTPLKSAAGDTLKLNCHVRRNGFIKVEVVGAQGQTIEDCDPIFGDPLAATVKWKGDASLKGKAQGGMTLRYRLRSAKLFSFTVA
jgi:hypothetical protein